MTTSVVNINHRPQPKCDIYVGRAGRGQSGYFGNIHSIGDCPGCFKKFRVKTAHEPDECMALYEAYFFDRVATDGEFRFGLMKLRDRVLGCFCVKRDGTGRCHALVIARFLDSLPVVATEEEVIAAARAELAKLAATTTRPGGSVGGSATTAT